jgi:hypothetical protein
MARIGQFSNVGRFMIIQKPQKLFFPTFVSDYNNPERYRNKDMKVNLNKGAIEGLFLEQGSSFPRRTNGRCAVSGILMDTNEKKKGASRNPFQMSIDAIDPCKGHEHFLHLHVVTHARTHTHGPQEMRCSLLYTSVKIHPHTHRL